MKENLLKKIDELFNTLKSLIVSKNIQSTRGKKLFEIAKTFIGTDASPQDVANDEYGCAESVNAICEKAWSEPLGGGVSTYRMYYALIYNRNFVQVLTPLPGDIVLSPTGIGGGKNNIKNGHVGIISENGKIMSNDSRNGKWLENYDLYTWKYRYVTLGGFKMLFFRRVF